MKLIRQIDEFKEDEEGATLVLWGVMFIILFGLVAMSFDMGRVGVTRSELQSYADHVALAAAGELNGRPGARARATDAAQVLISDFQTFGSGGQLLSGASDFTITFHSDLPDRVLGATQFVATSDADAQYVRIQAVEQTVPFSFARAFHALTGTTPANNRANAFAVAGMSSFACDSVQLWFCIPSTAETNPDGTIPADTALNLRPGQMVHMVAGTSDGQFGPGNWGFIEEAMFDVNDSGPCAGIEGTGPRLRCILGAAQLVGGCFNTDGIDTEPGIKTGITGVSINTRFDIYEGAMQGESGNSAYAPAPIVTKGIKPRGGASCIRNNVDPTTNTAALGRDDCFLGLSNTCREGRFGDGDWDFEEYMSANYDTDGTYDHVTRVETEGYADVVDEYPDWYAVLKPTAASPNPSRWAVYQEEVKGADLTPGPDALPDQFSSDPLVTDVAREEDGLPSCGATPNTGGLLGANGERRRVMIAAGIDCSPPQVINGSARDVPIVGYIEFFLTEPAANDPNVNGNQVNVWGEVIEVYETGTSDLVSILRDVPMLMD